MVTSEEAAAALGAVQAATDRVAGEVSAEIVGRRVGALVVALLVVLVVLGIGAALALNADGAGHPSIWAGLLIGTLAVFGGPDILAAELSWLGRLEDRR